MAAWGEITVDLQNAVKLKNVGFNEFCKYGYWYSDKEDSFTESFNMRNSDVSSILDNSTSVAAPSVIQVTDWLIKNYNIFVVVHPDYVEVITPTLETKHIRIKQKTRNLGVAYNLGIYLALENL